MHHRWCQSYLVFFHLTFDTRHMVIAVWWLSPLFGTSALFSLEPQVALLYCTAICLVLPLLFLAKLACFSLRLRGKSALCRSADKSFLLVTHCLTHAHTHIHAFRQTSWICKSRCLLIWRFVSRVFSKLGRNWEETTPKRGSNDSVSRFLIAAWSSCKWHMPWFPPLSLHGQ